MSLVQCRECGTEISTKASVCPHCGAKRHKGTGCAFSLLVSLLVCVLALIAFLVLIQNDLSSPTPENRARRSAEQAASDTSTAYYKATELIKKFLKSPSTAKFSSIHDGEAGCSRFEGNIWEAVGYVDSQNSFGAMLRNPWHAYVEKDPHSDTWTLKYLQFEDTILGVDPRESRKAIDEVNQLRALAAREAEQARVKAQETEAWRARRLGALRKQYGEAFQDLTGTQAVIRMASGLEMTGLVKRVSTDSVELEMPNGTIEIPKTSLSDNSRRRCYREDYVEYYATLQFTTETGGRWTGKE